VLAAFTKQFIAEVSKQSLQKRAALCCVSWWS